MPTITDVIPILLKSGHEASSYLHSGKYFVPRFVLEVPLDGGNTVLFVMSNFPRKPPCYVHSQPKRNLQLSPYITNFSTSLTIPCRQLFLTIEVY